MNNFNLINEKWIPSNIGNVSIKDCFENENISFIGENPIETISIFKFLQAIGTASTMFNKIEEKLNYSIDNFKNRVLSYLNDNYNDFYLYGDNPFLQFNSLKNYDETKYVIKKNFNDIIPFISSGNNKIYNTFNKSKEKYSNEEKAKYFICELGFCKNSKDNFAKSTIPVRLTKNNNYIKYAKCNENGLLEEGVNSCLGLFCGNKGNNNGMLHEIIFANSILKSIFINLMTNEDLNNFSFSKIKELGIPPWKINNLYEDHEYKYTYFGSLIPMNRFMLLNENNNELYYTEGIRNTDGIINEALQQTSIFNYSYELNDKSSEIGKKLCQTSIKAEFIIHPFESLGVSLITNKNENSYAQINILNIINFIDEYTKDNIVDLNMWIGGCEYIDNTGLKYYNNFVESTLLIDKMFNENNFKIFLNYLNKIDEYINENILNIKKYKKKMNDNNFRINDYKSDCYIFINDIYSELYNNICKNFNNSKIEEKFNKFIKNEYTKYCNNINDNNHYEFFYKFYPKNKFTFN